LIVGALHPAVAAGTVEHSNYRSRPVDRLRTTSRYVNATVFGDTEAARNAAAMVRRAHRHVHGTEPITGKPYDAADHGSQIWVHSVAWHSYLVAYRTYVAGLSDAEQDRYMAEGVAAASILGVPAELVPSSVAQQRQYWEAILPQLCVGANARELIDFVLHPVFPTELLPFRAPYEVLVQLAIAIIPRHLRAMAGLSRPRAIDAAVRAAGKPLAAALGMPGPRDLMEILFGNEVRALRRGARGRSKGSAAKRVA